MNDSQQRSILIGFQDIHRRLAEFESILTQRLISSPFSEYVDDLSPTEAKVIQDYFVRLRATMVTCLNDASIPQQVRRTSTRWALQCGMTFLHIAVSELSPERLRGYGDLDAEGRAQALNLQQELNRLIDRMAAYLNQGLGKDLAQRLSHLEATEVNVNTLRVLDRIVTRWGLVEFRPLLDYIVRRFETPQFEIAVFGRVSSGKSSLLNHIVGADVLPVGVTPVTAVPTRLVKGDRAVAMIAFAESSPQTVPVEDLHEYASEEGNPGNKKHAIGILVQLPTPRLPEGVNLVDTPGIGSLAKSGGTETFAYLPRCDLGVVLIDAASTLTPDDLDLLRLLYEAGIPAQVLLSKADLVSPADRQRTVGYVRSQIRQELGLDLQVHPVSTVGADETLLVNWFEHEIEPLFARHRDLAELSLRRKVAHLRESVIAVLQTLVGRSQSGGHDGHQGLLAGPARQLLDKADEAVRKAELRCRAWRDDEASLLEIVVRDASAALVNAAEGSSGTTAPAVLEILQRVLAERDQMAQQLLKKLQSDLVDALDGLQKSAPFLDVDGGSIRDLVFRGLPAPDCSALQERFDCRRPWWALSGPMGDWAMRRAIVKRLGPMLQEQIETHDRQLLAWLKRHVSQLRELYESHAEVFREQARRLTAMGDNGGPGADADAIRSDLRELQHLADSAPALASDANNVTKGLAHDQRITA